MIDKGKLLFSGSVEALARKMQGDAPLEIRLAGDADERALDDAVSILSEFPGVTAIEALEGGLLAVELVQDDRKVAGLIRRLIEGEVPVVDVHRRRMNLEHVFLEVTQG
jgi:ABC-type multidrug transport system ATPase subunit